MIVRRMRIADMPHRLAFLARHGPLGEAGRAGAAVLPPAAHRAIVCVDVEGFGDQRRTTADQVAVREGPVLRARRGRSPGRGRAGRTATGRTAVTGCWYWCRRRCRRPYW